jgi:hypothetical protein
MNMTPKPPTSINKIARTVLIAASALLLIVSVAFGAAQKSDKECRDSAYKHYKSNGYDKMGCGSSTHYNMKLNACFIRLVCDSDQGKKVLEYVENVTSGKNQARYINTRPSTSTGTCIVDGKQCGDYYEFEALIKPYIGQ